MKKLLSAIAFCLCVVMLHAQSISIENVLKMSPGSLSAIKEGSDIKGYYFYYASDKIDKKTNEYTLRIFDNNLKALKDVKFQDSKDVRILESSFNGTDLVFLFFNEDERTFEYQVYGANGQRKPYNYRRELTKKELQYLKAVYPQLSGDEDATYKGLYPVEGKGFISNTPSREDKDYTFEISYFSTEKNKQWSYIPTDGKKFAGDYLGTFNGVVYVQMLKFSSLFDGKPESVILGLDLETGKKLFEKSTDSKYRFYPSSMSQTNAGKSFIYGEYFDAGANVMKDKSSGFAFWSIDNKGNITSEKYVSWVTDFGKFVNVSSKGKIENLGYMLLHNMVQTADGNIYAIGEGFSKSVDGFGMASKVLLGGGSGFKMKITDMVLIKFDKDFNVKDVKIYEKNANNAGLPASLDYASAPLMAKIVKGLGGFDYEYTQTNKDASAFTVCYSDYVKEKDYKGGTFNSISFNDGKISTDRLNIKSDATYSWVVPGKQGQVLVVDYYKKEKKVLAHFEKLN